MLFLYTSVPFQLQLCNIFHSLFMMKMKNILKIGRHKDIIENKIINIILNS